MASSNPDNYSEIPNPSETGTSGSQINADVVFSVPENSTGSLTSSPLYQVVESLGASNSNKLGQMPALVAGIIQENMYEKRRLDIKTQELEKIISTQNQEISQLRVKNAELKTTLNAESRIQLMRKVSITIGIILLSSGYGLAKTPDTFNSGFGLMFLGFILALFGWLSRIAKEAE